MESPRALLQLIATPVVWALIPGIALGADTVARALPRATRTGSPSRPPPATPWRDRVPFLAALIGTLAIAWWRFGPGRTFLGAAVDGTILLMVGAIDWRHRLIFERLLLAGGVGALGVAALDLPETAALVGALIAGCLALALAAGLFLALRRFYRRALPAARTPLGSGDALLAGMIGTMLGRETAPALALGAALAGLATLAALLAGRLRRRDPVPLGSFLSWGALIVLLCR